MENMNNNEVNQIINKCYLVGLLVCEEACTFRKEIATRKKEMNLENDSDVFLDAEPYLRENLEVWEEKLKPIEEKVSEVSSLIASLHSLNYKKWTTLSFWNDQMRKARGFQKEIHFFPNKVIRFLDWARHTINSGYKSLEEKE